MIWNIYTNEEKYNSRAKLAGAIVSTWKYVLLNMHQRIVVLVRENLRTNYKLVYTR